MASEINYNLQLQRLKGYASESYKSGTLYADQTGSTATGGNQTIGTAAEALVMGDVTTSGFSWFRNTDATNFVEIGTGTGTSFAVFIKLKAGEAAVCRLGTNAPTAKANTASINLQYHIMQD